MKHLSHILILFVAISAINLSQTCASESSDELKYIHQLSNSFIVNEFEAKNVSVLAACKKLNELFTKHQKNLGLTKFGIIKINLQNTPAMQQTNVFLHLKNVKLTTILRIICEQNNLSYRLEKNEIKVFFPIE